MNRFIALILAIAAVNNIIRITPGLPTAVYYGVFAVALVIGVIAHSPKISALLSFLILGIFFSLIVNSNIPAYFKVEERFLSFLIMIALLSPWLFQNHLAEIRGYLFQYTNLFLVAVVIISFLGSISGIYSGIGRADLYEGLTTHSMLLGPIAGLVLLVMLRELYAENLDVKNKLMYLGGILICLYTMLQAGSRAALLASFLSILVFLILKYKNQVEKLINIGVVLFILSIATFPYWSAYTEKIDKKTEYAEEQDDAFASRSELWSYRYQEFVKSPVFGIGFATAEYGAIDTESGRIEPGTSWGALLAQIGVFGTLPFIFLFFGYSKKLYQGIEEDEQHTAIFLLALIVFFFIHMIFEGYILASGSFLFFYVWLLMGRVKNKIEEDKLIEYE